MTTPTNWELRTALDAQRRDWGCKKLKHLASESRRLLGNSDVRAQMLSVSGYHGVVPKKYEDENQMRSLSQLESYLRVEPGQLAVNCMWLNNRGLGVSQHSGVVSPAYRVYDPQPEIHHAYLHHLLRSNIYVGEYTRLSYGIRPNSLQVSREDFDAIPLLVPPLETQKAIADFLDEKTAAIDAVVEKKQRMIELLEEKRAAVINQVVTKGLDPSVPMKDSGVPWIGEIPARWDIWRLPFLLASSPKNGLSPPVSSQDNGIVSFSIAAVRNGQIQLTNETIKYVNTAVECSPYQVKNNDILLIRGNGNRNAVGRAGIIDSIPEAVCIYPDILIRIRANLRVAPEFLLASINSSPVHQQFTAVARTSTGTWKINGDSFKNVVLPLPPLDEQGLILTEIQRVSMASARKIEKLTKQISLLKEYRQSLITEAVTGKLPIRELAHA